MYVSDFIFKIALLYSGNVFSIMERISKFLPNHRQMTNSFYYLKRDSI